LIEVISYFCELDVKRYFNIFLWMIINDILKAGFARLLCRDFSLFYDSKISGTCNFCQ